VIEMGSQLRPSPGGEQAKPEGALLKGVNWISQKHESLESIHRQTQYKSRQILISRVQGIF